MYFKTIIILGGYKKANDLDKGYASEFLCKGMGQESGSLLMRHELPSGLKTLSTVLRKHWRSDCLLV